MGRAGSPAEGTTLFEGYLRMRRFDRPSGPVEVLSGPGHDVVVVTCYVRGPDGRPRFVVKTGDTRPARVLRGRPYVKHGLVAGRLDHAGQSPADVARIEVEEEVGARVVGDVVELGPLPVPTMPLASTEADLHVLAEVAFDEGARPRGDGGGMEVPELLGHDLVEPDAVVAAVRAGAIGEAARARVGFGRALERLGLREPARGADSPSGGPLGGAGEADSPSGGPLGGAGGSSGFAAPPPGGRGAVAGGIDGAEVRTKRAIELATLSGRLLDAEGRHLSGDRPVGSPFPIQILDLALDEVEVVGWARGPGGEPWVAMERQPSPVLLVKADLQDEVRSGRRTPTRLWAGALGSAEPGRADAAARTIARERGWGEPERLLESEASPGQSTLVEYLYASSAPFDAAVMRPLSESLRLVREEGGSARTEALLFELLARR